MSNQFVASLTRSGITVLGAALSLSFAACSSVTAARRSDPTPPHPAQAQSKSEESAAGQALESPAQASTSACKIAHAQDFDFWLGRWEVRTADGTLAGYNHIHPILDGCTIQEDYRTGDGKYIGRSLNRFDPASQAWRQVWVDNGGMWLSLSGGLQGEAMVLRGEYLQRRDAKGALLDKARSTLQEIRWTLLPDKRVQQRWRSSTDGGQSWTTLFDGFYTRIEAIPTLKPN